jgi:hypothetical protein
LVEDFIDQNLAAGGVARLGHRSTRRLYALTTFIDGIPDNGLFGFDVPAIQKANLAIKMRVARECVAAERQRS